MNLTPRNPLIEGTSVTLSTGDVVVIAPFNAKRSKKLCKAFDAIDADAALGQREKNMAMKLVMAQLGLSTNYGEISPDALEEDLRVGDFDAIIASLTTANDPETTARVTGQEQQSQTGTV